MLCSLVVSVKVVGTVRQQLKLVLCVSSILAFCLPSVRCRVVLFSRDPAEIRRDVVLGIAVYVVDLKCLIVLAFWDLAICLSDYAVYRDKLQ